MRGLSRQRRRLPSSNDSHSKKSFWTLSRVLIIIAIVAWILTIFILYRQRRWQGPEQRAVLVVQSVPDTVRLPLRLVVLKPGEKIYILNISPEQKIATPFKYGTYTSDALVGLTQMEEMEWSYLEYLIALEFGVAVEGIIWTDSPVTSRSELSALSLQAVLNRKSNTMPWWDRLTLWHRVQQTPSYQVESVDLGQYLISDTKLLDTTRYDRWAELYLQDSTIRGSGYSVAVQNGSGIEGYAGRVGRMLGLMGYDLRSIDTVGTSTLSEVIWSQSNRNEWESTRLQTLFSSFSQRIDPNTVEQARSRAVVRLGTDQTILFQPHH
jgi:hypothetical protein